MKYLSDYMEEGQSALFKEMKVFFAFSDKQFEEGLKKHNLSKKNKIASLGQGMFCPKKNGFKVVNALEGIYKLAIERDIKENGIENIIYRELSNHECFYTSDITDCVEKLSDYPINKEEIIEVFHKNYQKELLKF